MWNRIDKLTKAIIIMAIIATVTFFGAVIFGKEREIKYDKKQLITKINNDIRDKMIKADEEGMKYR